MAADRKEGGMNTALPRRAFLVALALAAGCASEDAGPTGPASFSLADGTVVDVMESGAVRLSVGGRVVFEMADGVVPVAKTYEETYQGPFAIWTFERKGEIAHPLGKVRAREMLADGAIEVRFSAAPSGAEGRIRVSPLRPGASRVRVEISGVAETKAIAVPLACHAESTFFGFGEQYGPTDARGQAFSLLVSEQGIGRDPAKPPGGLNGDAHTTYFPMPYFVDARGFGLLATTRARTLVDLCKTDPRIAWLEATSPEPLDLVVFHGPRPLDVIRELGDEVGRPKSPPTWAYGLWIGAQGGRDAVLAETSALEAAGVPAKVLWVQDWTGIRRNLDGGFGVQYRWEPDETLYPDLKGMISSLKERGYRFLSYANPFVVKGQGHYEEMASRGLLIQSSSGGTYDHFAPNGSASHPDLTNPAARDYVKSAFRQMVVGYGMDGWMEDFGEWLPLDARYANGADSVAMHNAYPIEWHRLSREVMDEVRPDGDWVVFARSGYTGVQGVAQVYWVGDQEATFSPHDGLPTVVPAMVSLGLSGIPYVTHDIAGFSGGPSDKELFQRWVELGAFTPIMRTHQGNKKTENWSWKGDAETTAHFVRFARIHEKLGPEISALSAEAARTSSPIVRHLMVVFPDDADSRKTHDEMMLGDTLLVAPVVERGATKRRLYLPPGKWFHVWTGASYEGARTIEVEAPIGSPPVFSRGVDRPDLRAIR